MRGLLAVFLFGVTVAASFAQAPPSADEPQAEEQSRVLAVAEKLEPTTPNTPEQVKEQLIREDVCGAPLRSEKYLCAVAIYRAHRYDFEKTKHTLVVGIKEFPSGREFRPGAVTAESSAIKSRPRSAYKNARSIISTEGNVLQEVTFKDFLRKRPAKGFDENRNPIDGSYHFVGIVGRLQNEKENIGLPETLFRAGTFRR